jgi:hypothetical protein
MLKERGRGNYGITLYGMYRAYRRVIGMKSGPVDYKTYAAIIKEFNIELAKVVIENAFEFRFPFRLGKIRIKKYKLQLKLDKNGNIDKRKLPVDWKRTWELWFREYPDKTREEIKQIQGKQRVFLLNEHTDGYQCKFIWDKYGCNIPNNRVYSLVFTRTNSRLLAEKLKSGSKVNYYE